MLLVFRFELIKNVLEFIFQNLKSGIGNCFEIPHFVVNYALCACVFKIFQLFKVGHMCIILQQSHGLACIVLHPLQRAFSSVFLTVDNINQRRC